VYLLNAVTEEDLMALAEQSGRTITPSHGNAVSAIPDPEQLDPAAANPVAPVVTPTPEPEAKPPAIGMDAGKIAFIVIAALIFGGVAYYFKIVKGKKNSDPSDDDYDDYEDDYDDKEEDYSKEEPEEEGENE
jgi:hypothetical protein